MKKNLLLSASFALLMAAACSVEETGTLAIPDEIPVEPVVQDMKVNYVDGLLKVKLSEELESVDAVAALLSDAISVLAVTPTFPDDPRYTERHREAGLHLWYTVQYDGDAPATRAASDLAQLPGIEIAEGVPTLRSEAVQFNDPMLYRQWHYINTGQQNGYLAGSDINLDEAWDFNTGSSDVIVAVIDTGIRYTHEDLRNNMWVNEAELNGIPGYDDDGNGYVDDIYGFNFCYVESYNYMHGTIVPEDHGTHTAGTIAAENNNGLGGCGIAGGDGMRPGVRIMGLQIIQERTATSNYPSDADAAFVYAADNGAVLSNNSWGYDGRSSSTQNAIAYFNRYAGTNARGEQTGPMIGGLAVFAAGNDNTTTGYPAQYNEAYAVASIGPDFKRAYYSNYGDWVDICAPGGDQVAHGYYNGGVYSSVARSDSAYDYYQGTSMACPHVTGVAALAVSAFGGEGFTRQDLIDLLNENANPDVYKYNAAMYSGKLGVGLVDAGAMFSGNRPQPVSDLAATASKNTITLTWTVPAAGEDCSIVSFEIGFDSETITYETPAARTGDALSYTFENLQYDTEYSFAIRARNDAGRESKLSPVLTVRTEPNRPPVIIPQDGVSMAVNRNAVKTIRFKVEDEEGDAWTCKIQGRTVGVGAEKIDDETIEVEVRGAAIYESNGLGTYTATLYVTDEFDNTSTLEVSYTIRNRVSPVFKNPIGDQMMAVGENLYLTLSDYFVCDANASVDVRMDQEIVSWSAESGTVRLTARAAGETGVTLSVYDQEGEKAEGSFRLLVRGSDAKAEIYPTAVKDCFYVRTGISRDINVRLVSQTGQTILSRDFEDVGPFNPAKVDLPSKCSAGVYTAVVTFTDGSQVKQTIIIL